MTITLSLCSCVKMADDEIMDEMDDPSMLEEEGFSFDDGSPSGLQQQLRGADGWRLHPSAEQRSFCYPVYLAVSWRGRVRVDLPH